MRKLKETYNRIVTIIKDRIGSSNNSENKPNYYTPLSPTNEAEGCEVYLEALEWALENKQKIKNIAISGPYGSGKSSVLQTFIKRCESKKIWSKIFPKYRFFNISLATFKDIKNNSQKDVQNSELQRLIELSILQQLFFHEKDSKIPDSRFKKIKRQKRIGLLSYSIGFISLLISVLFIITPEFLKKFSLVNFNEKQAEILQIIASLMTLVGVFLIIYKLSRSIIGFSIKKLKINSAEIEIEEGISKSILNNHLDEIIYFFEVTKYNVVIIEDLDRFEQSEVFTKLREINLLINNSEKVKRDIIFIYAIKDDMFKDKDRAKFFDFMIPIIPVINFSNSGNKLRLALKHSKHKIKEDLLDDLSMFIDDMRLLYNIINEFHVYSNKINNNLDMNKLLSIIVYKNVYPNDFTKLNENKGDLYNTIRKKNEYINSIISKLNKQIAKLKEEIKRYEEELITNLGELRIIYLSKVIEQITNGFVGFNDSGELIAITKFTSDEYFSQIQNGNVEYFHFNSYYGRNDSKWLKFNFSDIEKQVSTNFSYDEREDFILDKNKINNLKKEIEKINNQKNQLQKDKLKDILSNKYIEIEAESSSKTDLINILLRNGYIDENYLDYISIFHEGALTKLDYQFLINVKTEKVTNFDFKLNKTEELLKKINEFAFEKEYILNYDLVDKILISKKFDSKKARLFTLLSNESERSIHFIDEYIDRTTDIELFISTLCKNWSNIWSYIYSNTLFSDERIDKYLQLIIQYANIDDFESIFYDHKKFLNNYSELLNIPTEYNRIKNLIKKLNLKFNSINVDSPEKSLKYVFENNHYSVSIEMLRTIFTFYKGMDLVKFNKANFSFISESGLDFLINYIESNINVYVKEVFLNLEQNREEDTKHYLTLLNNPNIDVELKEKIIIKTDIIIENTSSVSVLDVSKLLLKYSKIEAKWDNILPVFEQQGEQLCDNIISFFNSKVNSEKLSKSKIPNIKNTEGVSGYSKFYKAIMHELRINIESYKLLTNSSPWWYETFDSDKLTKERVIILIDNLNVNPTLASYNYLKENFEYTNIHLLDKCFSHFEKNIEELPVDSYDLEHILKTKDIKLSDKLKFVDCMDNELIAENPENLKKISEFLIEYESIKVRDSLLALLLNSIEVTKMNRVKLFNKYIFEISKNDITSFLCALGGEYDLITNTSKKATIENNRFNEELLEKLIELDYISSISIIDKGLRVNHKRKEE